jgi:hypothetical protein
VPAFVRGYRWVACLLIAGYLLKSALVEWLWFTRPYARTRLGITRKGMAGPVLLANMASYLLVGPLFYWATRPHFAGLTTTFDAQWTANPEQVVYYVDAGGQLIRSRMDGCERRQLARGVAGGYVVAGDEGAVLFQADTRALRYQRVDEAQAVDVIDCGPVCAFESVSLSPDNREVAYRDSTERDSAGKSAEFDAIRVFNTATGETRTIGQVPRCSGGIVAWSAAGDAVFAAHGEPGDMKVYRIAASGSDPQPTRCATVPASDELVDNYMNPGDSSHGRFRYYRRRKSGDLAFTIHGGMAGSQFILSRQNDILLALRNEYGFILGQNFPHMRNAGFLPHGNEILIDWADQSYVLDYAGGRLGLLTQGRNMTPRTRDFRVSFDRADE